MVLLKIDKVTAYQLGNLSKIPSGRIYDVVESLISKGLIFVLPGTPRLVKAIAPKIALKALLDKKNIVWKRESSQLNHLINKLEQKEENEIVSLSKGENLYYQNVIEMHSKVKNELLDILGRSTVSKKGIDLVTPTKMIIKKGAEIKTILPLSKDNEKVAKQMKRLGIKVRDYPVKNLRMHIVDGKYAMITIVDKNDSKNKIIIKINQEESVKTLREMFLALWEKSKEI